MKKRKKGRRFSISAVRQAPEPRAIKLEPEELARYVRRAEKQVLPILKERQLGPGTAQLLLAQQTQVLVTDDPRLTVESGMAIANSVLALWQEGYYTPGPAYPYTLEETLQDIQGGLKAKRSYKDRKETVNSILTLNEIQHCLDLRRIAIDPEGCVVAFAVRHVGPLTAGVGGVYGQSDVVDGLHPSECEVHLTRAGEMAEKTTRFLSEWQIRWGMQSEDDSSQRTERARGL